jgi:hypothetical protein
MRPHERACGQLSRERGPHDDLHRRVAFADHGLRRFAERLVGKPDERRRHLLQTRLLDLIR